MASQVLHLLKVLFLTKNVKHMCQTQGPEAKSGPPGHSTWPHHFPSSYSAPPPKSLQLATEDNRTPLTDLAPLCAFLGLGIQQTLGN